MPPVKRRHDNDNDTAAENKRFKSAIEESAAEFVCPITQELPLDPVTAEDGHVYERAAIEDWLSRGNGKSPATNEQMGSKLLPALQVKNMISSMVKSGALSGDIVEQWLQRIQEEERVQELQAAVEAGDETAMCDLGVIYRDGKYGVRKSQERGFLLFKRAADAGHPRGLYYAGICYNRKSNNGGCEPNAALALYCFTRAAEAGSRGAAFGLGKAFCEGQLGLPKDVEVGARWLRTCLEPAIGSVNRLGDGKGAQAEAMLAKYAPGH